MSRVKGTKQDGEDLISNQVQETVITTRGVKDQGQGTVTGAWWQLYLWDKEHLTGQENSNYYQTEACQGRNWENK